MHYRVLMPVGCLTLARLIILCAGVVATVPAVAVAEVITFTETFQADFKFNFLAGTPFNTGAVDTGFIPFRAVGDLTFTLFNDHVSPTLAFTSVTGMLNGVSPTSPPSTLPFFITPNVGFLGGNLTNVVYDGSGGILSANVSDLSMFWKLVGTPFNVTLYGKVGLPFDASNVSIPFSPGTVLTGAQPFEVYLEGGPDTPVIIGADRTLTAVPEPNSVALSGLCGIGVFVAACRRRRTTV